MVFVADDLAAWLTGVLADAGRKKLTSLVLGSDQERAVRSAATAAVQLTAAELRPERGERAAELAMVISQVFSKPVPSAPLAGHATVLEALQAGVAGQLAVLDDACLTGTGQSSAEVLGMPGAVVAAKLTGHLLREIVVRGARGGPLLPLASQLNDDVTHLQGQRIEAVLGQLAGEVREALAQLPAATAGFTGRSDELGAAVKQLGSGNASVRIGALYALERLAEDHAGDRQRVTEQICAYLRMSSDPPPGPAQAEHGDEDTAHESPGNGERRAGRAQEVQVRLVAQQVLARHLREPRAPDRYTRWLGMQIDLRGAKLTDIDLAACELSRADFRDCQFIGDARFDSAQFTEDARFDRAQFTEDARFDRAQFTDDARFDGARFRKVAGFDRARFGKAAGFDSAHFGSDAAFTEADFGGAASFRKAEFHGLSLPLAGARFSGARFSHAAQFKGAWFETVAGFANTEFCGNASFADVKFGGAANFSRARFDSQAWFALAEFQGRAEFIRAIFDGKAQFHRARFTMPVEFDEAEFHAEADYGETLFDGHASFRDARFHDGSWFVGAQFAGTAVFHSAKFLGTAQFGDNFAVAKFRYMPDFADATAIYDNDRHRFPKPWKMERPPAGMTIARLVRL